MVAVCVTVPALLVPVNCTAAEPDNIWLADFDIVRLVEVIVSELLKECSAIINDFVVPVRVYVSLST